MFFKRTLTTFHFKNSECDIIIDISKYLIFFFRFHFSYSSKTTIFLKLNCFIKKKLYVIVINYVLRFIYLFLILFTNTTADVIINFI